MIEFSVQTPMFRVKYIAWLALESLCRQEGIDFEWELVIAEEQVGSEVFGIEEVDKYRERLKEAGCSRICYIPLEHWITLAEKICLTIRHCSESSKYLMFQSADYYSSPYILADSYNMFENNPDIDWFACIPYKIFYDIQSGISRMAGNSTKGPGRVMRIGPARLIKPVKRRRGCDKWFMENYRANLGRPMKVHNDTKQWKYAFDANGFHNCTLSRGPRMRKGKWKEVPFDWMENIPEDIIRRVESLKDLVPYHVLGLPKGSTVKRKKGGRSRKVREKAKEKFKKQRRKSSFKRKRRNKAERKKEIKRDRRRDKKNDNNTGEG